jgi:hypothetical protein
MSEITMRELIEAFSMRIGTWISRLVRELHDTLVVTCPGSEKKNEWVSMRNKGMEGVRERGLTLSWRLWFPNSEPFQLYH